MPHISASAPTPWASCGSISASASRSGGCVPGSNQLLVTLPAAMLVAALAAAVIGALSLRTSGVQFIMITLAFAQMVFFLFVGIEGLWWR